MIPHLSSPSVCVIDDEEADYRPILDALMRLGLGCVHIRGDSAAPLPPIPFKGLRLIFIDLHLAAGPMGKSAASHTANVFRSVVSPGTAPVVVVIWSKYANDIVPDESLPPEDQPTESDLFKAAMLEAEPEFATRLVFLEMPKPKRIDRPADDLWVDELTAAIDKALSKLDALEALWAWEGLVRDAGLQVSETLTSLAGSMPETKGDPGEVFHLNEHLRVWLRLLAQQQGGPDCSETTASRHLMTVLSQLSQDEIETASCSADLISQGKWLAEKLDDKTKKESRSSKLNSLLLIAGPNPSFAAFAPGTVFCVADIDIAALEKAAGFSAERLRQDCFDGNHETKKPAFAEFTRRTKVVLVEITPACDFHQGNRRSALLLGGLACPVNLLKSAESKNACKLTPAFEDRFSTTPEDWALVICSRYRLTISHDAHPAWLMPWLRLRDILMTDIRNWHASQVARVGYLSF